MHRRRKHISIHAPPRGATCVSFSCLLWLSISIHAPPRGATSSALQRSPSGQLFQFTPLREGRRVLSWTVTSSPPFQFTPLREGRLEITESVSVAHSHFNSRPSARGDAGTGGGLLLQDAISIHAPPRGATSSSAQDAPEYVLCFYTLSDSNYYKVAL